MRKMNYFVGALSLGIGVLIGTLGISLLSNSSSPTSFISKLRGQDKIQTVSGTVSDPAQTPPSSNLVPDSLSGNSNTLNLDNPDAISNPARDEKDVLSLGQNGTNKDTKDTKDTKDIKDSAATAALSKLKQQIITDYKQDIGIFFGAWKSIDMETFRLKLGKAYTGDLFEKHARRAEEYLVQGIGLDVSQITFDRVDVESANENTATLRVDYRYSARDYNLADATPVGEEHEQTVHARVNLLKLNSRWMITGETATQ